MGAAGLHLAYQMALDSFFDNKKILIIEKERKENNDRTWSYWEKGNGKWDTILTKKWDFANFKSATFAKKLLLTPYSYKMLRSKDFYDFVIKYLESKSNFDIQYAEYISHKEENQVLINTKERQYISNFLFISVAPKTTTKTNFPWLNQHFLGWFIQTDYDAFDTNTLDFMDFSIPQKGNTRFMYILPETKRKALFEYTLFSRDVLEKDEYELAIQNYLAEKGILEYVVVEKEFGVIPMTVYPFWNQNTKAVMFIGSVGGWTKPSTGFTFKFCENISRKLIQHLKFNRKLDSFKPNSRFTFYDKIMLEVLDKNNEVGAEIFTSIFQKQTPEQVFDFLDQKSSLVNDIKIMYHTRPRALFTKAFFRSLKY